MFQHEDARPPADAPHAADAPHPTDASDATDGGSPDGNTCGPNPFDAGLVYATPPQETLFPIGIFQDAVADCKADNHGVHDSTAALNACLVTGSIFFPTGTYLVSGTLQAPDAWRTFQGENVTNTTLRLKDSAGGNFERPDATNGPPKPVIQTVDCHGCAPGNNGFHNYIFNLTIDTGNNNPNAAGIAFHASNVGAIRSVVVRSEDGQGVAGIDLAQDAPGPSMIESLEVDGFNYGVLGGEDRFSVTLEHITVSGQKVSGIITGGNLLNIRDLVSHNTVPAVTNGGGGFLTLIGAALGGGNGSGQAIVNTSAAGSFYLQDVATSGYASALSNRGDVVPCATIGKLADTGNGGPITLFAPPATLDLPVAETPSFQDNDPSHWVVVPPPNQTDDTAAIQAALSEADAGGATTVFFHGGHGPAGDQSTWYRISGTLHVPGTVKRIVGMETFIIETKTNAFTDSTNLTPFFRFEGGSAGDTVFFERFGFKYTNEASTPISGVVVDNRTPRTLVLRDVEFSGLDASVIGLAGDATTSDPTGEKLVGYTNEPGAGDVYFDDIDGLVQFPNPETAWMRQYDTEGAYSTSPSWDLTTNVGGTVWIFGLKTEKAPTILRTTAGGKTQVFGGFFYTATDDSPANNPRPVHVPAFVVQDSQMSLSFVEQVDDGDAGFSYETFVEETQGTVTKTLNASAIPYDRGPLGRSVPLYVSGSP